MNQPPLTNLPSHYARIKAKPPEDTGTGTSSLETLKAAAELPDATADAIANWVHATLHAHGDGH